MHQKKRKFTNGYYPSDESDFDSSVDIDGHIDVSAIFRSTKEENVMDEFDILQSKLMKLKQMHEQIKVQSLKDWKFLILGK